MYGRESHKVIEVFSTREENRILSEIRFRDATIPLHHVLCFTEENRFQIRTSQAFLQCNEERGGKPQSGNAIFPKPLCNNKTK